ncbi:hypothetical protein QOT17_009252 [Balamuthia mandrillaris]
MDSSCFLLLQTTRDHPILGINPGLSSTELVVTVQDKGVDVYEVFDQKCVHSWSLQSGRTLTVPAMEVTFPHLGVTEGRFFAVLDRNELCSWTRRHATLTASTYKFKQTIVQVLHSTLLVDSLLLVFADGSLRLCHSKLDQASDAVYPDSLSAQQQEANDNGWRVEAVHSAGSESTGCFYTFLLTSSLSSTSSSSSKKPAEKTGRSYQLHVFAVSPSAAFQRKKRKKANMTPEERNAPTKPQEISWLACHTIVPSSSSASSSTTSSSAFIVDFSLDFSSRSFSIYWNDGHLDIFNFPTLQALTKEGPFANNSSTPSYHLQLSTHLGSFKLSDNTTLPTTPANDKKNNSKNRKKKRGSAASSSLINGIGNGHQNDASSSFEGLQVGSTTVGKKGVVGMFYQSFLALAGRRHSTHDLKQDDKVVLTIWDTKYGVLHGTQEIVFEESETMVVTPIQSHERAIQMAKPREDATGGSASYLALALDHHIAICSIYIPPPTLAFSVGRMNATAAMMADPVSASAPPFIANIALEEYLDKALRLRAEEGSKGDEQQPEEKDEQEAKEDGDDKKSKGKVNKKNKRKSTGKDTMILVEDGGSKKERKEMETEDVQAQDLENKSKLRARFRGMTVLELTDKEWERGVDSLNEEEEAVLRQLIDPTKTPSAESFQAIFTPFLESKQTEAKYHALVVKYKSRKRAKKQFAKMEHTLRDNPQVIACLSPLFVTKAVHRCLESGFWEPLATLLHTQEVYTQSCPTLVPTLIEKDKLQLLRDLLLYCTDISDTELTRLATYFLSFLEHDSRKETNKESNTKVQTFLEVLQRIDVADAGKCTVVGGVNKFINMIVSKPKNDVFMLSCLRVLSIPHVMHLLSHLKSWVLYYCRTTSNTKASKKMHWVIPPLANVVDWINLLIDSHLSSIILMEECHSLVREVKTVIEEELKVCEKLEDLQGYIQHLQSSYERRRAQMEGRANKPKEERLYLKQKPDYSIEVLLL